MSAACSNVFSASWVCAGSLSAVMAVSSVCVTVSPRVERPSGSQSEADASASDCEPAVLVRPVRVRSATLPHDAALNLFMSSMCLALSVLRIMSIIEVRTDLKSSRDKPRKILALSSCRAVSKSVAE